jgi:hypothetical protein
MQSYVCQLSAQERSSKEAPIPYGTFPSTLHPLLGARDPLLKLKAVATFAFLGILLTGALFLSLYNKIAYLYFPSITFDGDGRNFNQRCFREGRRGPSQNQLLRCRLANVIMHKRPRTCFGARMSCMAALSTYMWDSSTSGYSFPSAVTRSRHSCDTCHVHRDRSAALLLLIEHGLGSRPQHFLVQKTKVPEF